MKRFLMLVSSSDGYDYECEYAYVAIDDELSKKILARRELFQMVSSKDEDFYEMRHWSHVCWFLHSNAGETIEEYLGEELMAVLQEDRIIELDDEDEEFSKTLIDDEDEDDSFVTRTDCDMLVISQNDFRWTAQPKYGSGVYDTEGISYEVLLEKGPEDGKATGEVSATGRHR